MANPATLADLRKMVQAGVRKVGRMMTRPGDDWVPILCVQDPNGVEFSAIDNEFFRDVDTKAAFTRFLRARLGRGIYRYALLLNTHGISQEMEGFEEAYEGYRRGEVRLQDVPGADEMLVLNVGDAEQEEVWTARIVRREKLPPVLEPWQQWDDAALSGRFYGLSAALRELPEDEPPQDMITWLR